MKNLAIRFILAGLVTGFTYLAFLSNTPDSQSTHCYQSSLSFGQLLAQSSQESNVDAPALFEEQIRKLNYAKFRRSLLRHRSIYYANED